MSDQPKYTIEVVEFSEPTTDPWASMDGAVELRKSRGYDPYMAVPIEDTHQMSEGLIVIGKLKSATSHDQD